jgi:hypothetical protein
MYIYDVGFWFLGGLFDTKLTWIDNINKIVKICKTVLNVMKCLTGSEWGASRSSLRKMHCFA